MRIGYSATLINPAFSADFHLDGVGMYTKLLYAALQKLPEIRKTAAEIDIDIHASTAGIENHIHVATDSKVTLIPCCFNSPRTLFQRKKLHPQQQPLAVFSAFLPQTIALHRNMEQAIDVFHSTDYLIPRLKHTPVIATLHDAIMHKTPEMASPRLRKIKNYLLLRSAQWADQLITVSQTMVADIVDHWHIAPEKISVVYNGIDPIWFEPVKAEKKQRVLTKYGIEKPFFLFVGTLQPRKNIIRLIRAYETLPKTIRDSHQLILAGRAGWSTGDIQNAITRLQKNGAGLWLNYLDTDEIRALYQAATCFVFPSLSEGFGLPVIEAFASNTAVICSNTTALPEIAGDSACLVDPDSVEAISHAMQHLIEAEDVRVQYVQKGALRAKQFSWQRCAQETLKIYQKLA